MAEEAKNAHVRGDKIPTYLATLGGLNVALWGLAVSLTFPGLAFIGAVAVAGAAALSDGAREKLKKIGDQVKNLGRDLKSHMKEDFSRFTGWFGKRREAKRAEKAASIEQATTAFRNGSSELQFNNAAKPAPAVQPLVEPAPAPVVKPPAPPAA